MVKPNIAKQASAGTALMPQMTAIATLLEPEKFEEFYESMLSDIASFKPDLTTALGRAQIAKMAHKVSKTKTFLDATGKSLNDDARKQINIVDESRRAMRERLDKLRDKVRLPLTEWEEREASRIQHVDAKFLWFQTASNIPLDTSVDKITKYLDELTGFVVREELFKDRTEEAEAARVLAMESCGLTIARIKKMDEDAAELQRLQQAEADRKRKADEEAAAAAKDKADQLRHEAILEEQREEALKREKRQKRDIEEAVAAVRNKAAAELAQLEAQTKKDREDAEKVAALDAKETARRQRNKKHRAEVELAATLAIATAGQIERVDANAIVTAIIAGGIPHVTLEF